MRVLAGRRRQFDTCLSANLVDHVAAGFVLTAMAVS